MMTEDDIIKFKALLNENKIVFPQPEAVRFDIDEKWFSKKMVDTFAVSSDYFTGSGSTATTTQDLLRKDARLIQILRGVRAGTIPVEDAALEIIEGRGLGRKSQFFDSTQLNLINQHHDEQQTLMGFPVKPMFGPLSVKLSNEFGLMKLIPRSPLFTITGS